MYEAFYGLNGKPFNLTPDPRFLYLSEKHKEAFAHLVYGVQNRSGFVMITGEIGTGKTTICRSLLSQLDEETELAFIFNPILSKEELLQKINEEFGIDTQANSVKALIDELNEYLLDCAARGKNCVLVIDEAQNLDTALLEQIRLLSNLETETQKLLQILLIGQPELVEKLRLPELRQLNQRITARYHLKELDANETKEYIGFRLRVAGGLKLVRFSRGAVKLVYKISKGTPRVINALCDRALLIGYTQESHEITSAIMRQAAKEVQGERVRAPRRKGESRLLPRLAMAVLALAIAVGAALVFIDDPRGLWSSFVASARESVTGDAPAASPKEPIRVADASPPDSFEPDAPEIEPASGVDSSEEPGSGADVPVTPAASEEVADDESSSSEPIATEQVVDSEPVSETAKTSNEEVPATVDTPPAELAIASVVPTSRNAVPVPPSLNLPPSVPTGWPDVLDPAVSLDAAFTALLGAWDVPRKTPTPLEPSNDAFAAFASSHGLSITFVEPTLDQLLTLNAPALTLIDGPTKQVWVALVGVKPDAFIVAAPDGGQQSVNRELFARHYAKRALILWKDPTPNARPVNPFTQGPGVRLVQEQLVDLGLLAQATEVYDRDVIDVIERIQRATGLTVDGIVGPQTRLLLAHWQANPPMPTLTDEPFPAAIRDRVLGVHSTAIGTAAEQRETSSETMTAVPGTNETALALSANTTGESTER